MDNASREVEIISPNQEEPFIDEWFRLASHDHFWMQWRLAVLLKTIDRLGLSRQSALTGLEIGCGHGVLRSQIEANTQWTIDGGDLDLQSLRSNPPGRGQLFLYNIFERQPRFREHYDLVYLFDVLEHIPDPAAFLDAALFHLKKGGLVMVNVPALMALHSRYDEVVGHLRRYNTASLTELLLSCHLRIQAMTYWGFSLMPLLVMRKVLTRPTEQRKEVVEKGFKVPHPAINSALKAMMRLETTLLPRAPLGTSLMAIASKD